MPTAGRIALALTLASTSASILALGVIDAGAQKQPPTMSLFGGALPASSSDIRGMRPDSVGAVARFSLSVGTTSNLRSRSNAPRRLQIALPDGKSVTCLLRPASRPGTMVVLGGTPVGGGDTDRCSLVVAGSQVIGEIDFGAGRYRIQPVGRGDEHAVVEVKTDVFPDESEPKRVPGETRPPSRAVPGETEQCDVKPPEGQQPKVLGPIRVMFLYTQAVRANAPNIRADIELLIAQLRGTFSAQRLGRNFSVAVELAHAQEVAYTEAGDMEKDLDRLTSPRDSIFGPIHALRDTHKADIVHLLIKGMPKDSCGIGWLNLSLHPQNAFSVSDHQCALQVYSAAHEIGHNIGMNHDRFVERKGKAGPEEFNYGFVAVQGGIRSLMAYNNQCAEQKKNCNRVLYLSSPNVRLGGGPFGRPLDHPEAAYNVEVLCRNAPAVSQFR
jgi:hypothetical protein